MHSLSDCASHHIPRYFPCSLVVGCIQLENLHFYFFSLFKSILGVDFDMRKFKDKWCVELVPRRGVICKKSAFLSTKYGHGVLLKIDLLEYHQQSLYLQSADLAYGVLVLVQL